MQKSKNEGRVIKPIGLIRKSLTQNFNSFPKIVICGVLTSVVKLVNTPIRIFVLVKSFNFCLLCIFYEVCGRVA